jgi:hypothetical protein
LTATSRSPLSARPRRCTSVQRRCPSEVLAEGGANPLNSVHEVVVEARPRGTPNRVGQVDIDGLPGCSTCIRIFWRWRFNSSSESRSEPRAPGQLGSRCLAAPLTAIASQKAREQGENSKFGDGATPNLARIRNPSRLIASALMRERLGRHYNSSLMPSSPSTRLINRRWVSTRV